MIKHYLRMICRHKAIFNPLGMMFLIFGKNLIHLLQTMKWIKIFLICI
ncbi:hypothetical protein BSAE_1757 [Bifidobacterium pullorum subsp. saeculare DSM 6531 = LMG 14934]|uniref:Uncharacterized protein n=1 Tax=Bifidobacterium pullorum subsp. saeculare DSM 6531 = LMG 14934 TaxID=1437611 RepID=A0A087CXX2_9BIFI|nr:hypothetical protein BSAE_1757 [Bifidobacterium pullorum subsp. saeculare DSM 6531 = LMG 14934]